MKTKEGVKLNQETSVAKLLRKYMMEKIKTSNVPMLPGEADETLIGNIRGTNFPFR